MKPFPSNRPNADTGNKLSNGTIYAIIFSLSFVYFLTYYQFTPNIVDEGLLVDSASRILHGQKMYRDFDHTYAPGRFYLMALLFKIFGEYFSVSRFMWITVLSLNVALIFFLSSKIVPVAFAALPALMLLIVPGAWPKAFEIFLPLFYLTVLYKYLNTLERKWLIVLGASSVIAILFRQDIGLHTIIVSLTAILAKEFIVKKEGFIKRGTEKFLLYSAIILLLVMPVVIYFWDTFPYLYHSLFSRTSSQLAVFSVPYPSLIRIINEKGLLNWDTFKTSLYYLPLIPYLAMACFLIVRFFKKDFGTKDLFLSMALIFSILLLGKLFIVPCYTHLMEFIPLSYIFVSLFAYMLFKTAMTGKNFRLKISAASILITLLVFIATQLYFNLFIMPNGTDNGSMAARKEMRVLINSPNTHAYSKNEDFNKVIKHINDCTRPGDYIYVFPQSAIFYFMTVRKNPTRQDFNAPLLTDTDAEKDIITSLKSKGVRFVIYDEVDTYIGVPRPPQQYFKNYAPRAYAFIMSNYTIIDQVGRYRIMLRKGA